MQHYEPDQGFVQVVHHPATGAIRLQVCGLKHEGLQGHFIYLDPTSAKLIGNQLIAHALRAQTAELQKSVQEGGQNVHE